MSISIHKGLPTTCLNCGTALPEPIWDDWDGDGRETWGVVCRDCGEGYVFDRDLLERIWEDLGQDPILDAENERDAPEYYPHKH